MIKTGVGTSVSSKGYKNRTKVPTLEEKEKGGGVSTPLEKDNGGTEVHAPDKYSNETAVPTPKEKLV